MNTSKPVRECGARHWNIWRGGSWRGEQSGKVPRGSSLEAELQTCGRVAQTRVARRGGSRGQTGLRKDCVLQVRGLGRLCEEQRGQLGEEGRGSSGPDLFWGDE